VRDLVEKYCEVFDEVLVVVVICVYYFCYFELLLLCVYGEGVVEVG